MSKESTEGGRWLRNILALGFTSLFNDISTEMMRSVFPFFILSELKCSAAILGFIEGVTELIGNFLKGVSGFISDLLGRRKILATIGYAISNIAKPFMALARVWQHALSIRVADRIGKGIRTAPRDALISLVAPRRHVGKAFGIHRALDQTGAVIGPIIAFILLEYMGVTVRQIFMLTAIPGAIAILIIAIFVSEVKVERKKKVSLKEYFSPKLISTIAPFIVFTLSFYSYAFILAYALALNIPGKYQPLIYGIMQIGHIIAGLRVGILLDKLGPYKASIIPPITFIALNIIMILGLRIKYGSLLTALAVMLAIAIIYGVVEGSYEVSLRSVIALKSRKMVRGGAYGLTLLLIGLSNLFCNSIVGSLWTMKVELALAYSTFVAILALTVMSATLGKEKVKEGKITS